MFEAALQKNVVKECKNISRQKYDIKSLQAQYQLLASKIQCLAYDPLDVTNRQWYSDLLAFQTGAGGLEKQLTHALQQAYNTAGHLFYKLHLLPVRALPVTHNRLIQAFWGSSIRVSSRPKAGVKGPQLGVCKLFLPSLTLWSGNQNAQNLTSRS